MAGELLIAGDFDIRARIYAKREYVVLDDNIEKGMMTTVGAFEANGSPTRRWNFEPAQPVSPTLGRLQSSAC